MSVLSQNLKLDGLFAGMLGFRILDSLVNRKNRGKEQITVFSPSQNRPPVKQAKSFGNFTVMPETVGMMFK